MENDNKELSDYLHNRPQGFAKPSTLWTIATIFDFGMAVNTYVHGHYGAAALWAGLGVMAAYCAYDGYKEGN